MKPILIAAALLLLSALPAQVKAQPGETVTNHVQVSLVPARTQAGPGETVMVAIEQNIDPEWHTYWTNPGDSGATPVITWTLPEGATAGPVEWPVPHRIPFAELVNYGYEGSVTMLQPITLPPSLPEGPVALAAEVEILVCRDICIPEMKSLRLILNDPATADVDNSAAITAAKAMMPVPLEGTGTYTAEGADLVVTIRSDDLPEEVKAGAAFIPGEWGIVRNSAPTRIDSTAADTLTLRQERDASRALSEITALPALITYSTADGRYAGLNITLDRDPALTTETTTEAAIAPIEETIPVAPTLSLFEALMYAMLGGMVLNLMPCVFPVLSIKAMKLVQIRDKGYGAAVSNGLAYTAGILVSFVAVGGVLLAVKAGGTQVGWGFQLQDPLVIISLAYLLFLIGLSFSGVFEIGGSFVNAGTGLANKGGLSGAFFTGVLATLVATPCTAPFMAGALGFALVQPATVAIVVFIALGLGLALPYMILCALPSATALLPRPGPWMVRMKEFLAFPMYMSAAWLVWVLSMQSGPVGTIWSLMGMVALAFIAWALTHRPQRGLGRIVVMVLVVMALMFTATPYLNPMILQPEAPHDGRAMETDALAVIPYTPEKLQDALEGQDPVFVYMTAAWCITCKVNEKAALRNDTVTRYFIDHKIAVFEGDWTTRNPDITAYLNMYGRSGVPLYVYYGPREGATGKRPAPVILPQILTPDVVTEALQPQN